jgi:hypothetical protein
MTVEVTDWASTWLGSGVGASRTHAAFVLAWGVTGHAGAGSQNGGHQCLLRAAVSADWSPSLTFGS